MLASIPDRSPVRGRPADCDPQQGAHSRGLEFQLADDARRRRGSAFVAQIAEELLREPVIAGRVHKREWSVAQQPYRINP